MPALRVQIPQVLQHVAASHSLAVEHAEHSASRNGASRIYKKIEWSAQSPHTIEFCPASRKSLQFSNRGDAKGSCACIILNFDSSSKLFKLRPYFFSRTATIFEPLIESKTLRLRGTGETPVTTMFDYRKGGFHKKKKTNWTSMDTRLTSLGQRKRIRLRRSRRR